MPAPKYFGDRKLIISENDCILWMKTVITLLVIRTNIYQVQCLYCIYVFTGNNMEYHSGHGFSTKDSDNDNGVGHCAPTLHT